MSRKNNVLFAQQAFPGTIKGTSYSRGSCEQSCNLSRLDSLNISNIQVDFLGQFQLRNPQFGSFPANVFPKFPNK
jgi:hypothetical protein